jgi:hypothetical protein
MEECPTTGKSRDILANPWLAFGVYCVPGIAIAVTANPHIGISDGWRTAVWTVALAIMGTACLANAVRCGRVHCYVTGPFFLLLALVSLLYGLGLVRLGRNGWSWIGLVILVGAIVLCCLPEMLLGKYRKGRAAGA